MSSREDEGTAQHTAESEAAQRVNTVLDRVRSSAQGLSLEELERLLGKEWLAEFGTDIPQETLVAFAPALAEGYMFHIRQSHTGLP